LGDVVEVRLSVVGAESQAASDASTARAVDDKRVTSSASTAAGTPKSGPELEVPAPSGPREPEPTVSPQGELKLPLKGGVLVKKWQVMRHARELVKAGELRDGDITLLLYIADNTDRDTGICRRQLRTLAIETGRSRSAAGESLARLVKSGLVLRQPRRASGNWKVSSDLSLNYDAAVRKSGHPMSAQPDIRPDVRKSGRPDVRPAGHNSSLLLQDSPAKKGRPPSRTSEPAVEPDWAELEHQIAACSDEKLRASLERLCAAMKAKKGMQGD
jgi:hypothetical protein